jgi:hypothetical protein
MRIGLGTMWPTLLTALRSLLGAGPPSIQKDAALGHPHRCHYPRLSGPRPLCRLAEHPRIPPPLTSPARECTVGAPAVSGVAAQAAAVRSAHPPAGCTQATKAAVPSQGRSGGQGGWPDVAQGGVACNGAAAADGIQAAQGDVPAVHGQALPPAPQGRSQGRPRGEADRVDSVQRQKGQL